MILRPPSLREIRRAGGAAPPMIHRTADIGEDVVIGDRTQVWHHTQICNGARVGEDCVVGSGVYIDRGVVVGNRVKIQTGAQLYHGAIVEDGVFVGPLVCLTNDKHPRAITPDGSLKTDDDWEVGRITVRYGASLGAGAVILPDVTVGRFAMVAAGAVVVNDVPDYGLVVGTPARSVGYVCACGRRLRRLEGEYPPRWWCGVCRVHHLELSEMPIWLDRQARRTGRPR